MTEILAVIICLVLMLLVAWLTSRLGIVVKPGGGGIRAVPREVHEREEKDPGSGTSQK